MRSYSVHFVARLWSMLALGACVGALGLCVPTSVFAASLALSPAAGSYTVGSTFSVQVMVDSAGVALNAVSGVVSFPASLLEVTAVSKGQSIVSLWVAEPTFSNTAGTLKFEGVVPNPGYTGVSGTIVTITFRVKAAGLSPLTFSDGSILANDGEGTEILLAKGSAQYTLAPAADMLPVTPASVPPASSVAAQSLPQVTSDTHPSEMWSRLTTGTFSFGFPEGTTALRLLVDDRPATAPVVTYAPPVRTREITELTEGVSYLHVAYKTDQGWSAVLHYMLHIDTVAPLPFTITETNPGVFAFSATDTLSGIAGYEIHIDGGVAIPFTDAGAHTFTAPTQDPGTHTLLVRALDRAGNANEATISFVTPASAAVVAEAVPAPVVADTSYISKGTFVITLLSVVIPFIALLLLLGALLYGVWSMFGGLKRHIRKEVSEARTVVYRAFALLQSELESDIETLKKTSVKRKLTREESKILKRLQQNLKDAERVISKEITDIAIGSE